MEMVLESKLLNFNTDKSVYMVLGNSKFRKSTKVEIKSCPIILANNPMKEVESYSYLGETISCHGVAQSVVSTINKIYGIAYNTIFEILVKIEDVRSEVPGAFNTALKIWEMAVLPTLLNSAECWMEIPHKALEKLNKLQETFYRVILKAGKCCPIPGLYWFTGGIFMKNKIIMKKLMFLHHLIKLKKTSLVSEILEVQKKMEFPGLWLEAMEHLRNLDINVAELYELNKIQWKGRVKNAVSERNKEKLLQTISSYKKLDANSLKEEDFKTKEYLVKMKLDDARTKFAIDNRMVKTVKSDFASDNKFADEMWECDDCKRIDSIRHIKVCPGYEHLRADKDLKRDEDLVKYFQEVLITRTEIKHDF